jgi:hypothetical protein
MTYRQFNDFRYSHVLHSFQCYNLLDTEGYFMNMLSKVKTAYIWNIFKQLTTDIMDKINLCH